MVGFNNSGVADLGGELAYDLRQKYAQIVGEHLEDIAQARKADNFSIYYKTLKDLFIIVKHKFKDKKIKIKNEKTGKDEEMTELGYYNSLIKKAVEIANKYDQTWLGINKDPKECAEIEEALNAIEMFLYEKIDDAKMFGGANTIPGL
jgi:hypothetical protein